MVAVDMVEAEGTAADIWEVVATSEAVDTMLAELVTTTVAELPTTTAVGGLITTQAADTMEVASVELACSTGRGSVIQDMDTVDIQVMVTLDRCIRHPFTASRSTPSRFIRTRFIRSVLLP